MSAVCGFVNLNKEPAAAETGCSMLNEFRNFPVHNTYSICFEHVFFGCHEHMEPKENNKAHSILRLENEGLSVVADITLDNRRELINKLNLTEFDSKDLSDCHLILCSYRKWKERCVDHLLGDFAFVIYDETVGDVFAARDHSGRRTLYYYADDNFFSFATTIKPLFGSGKIDKKLNELWLALFLSYDTPIHEVVYEQTVYSKIMQLPPSFFLRIHNGSFEVKRYWNPMNCPKMCVVK